MKWKPYPAYKDSGVEWLGKIPAHWVVRRLKNIASVELSNVDKKSVEGHNSVRLCNYLDVYNNERITAGLDFMAATATPAQARRFALRKGDVLITKDSESSTDIAVPALVSEDLPGVICGYHLAHIRPGKECDGAFLSRAFAAIGPRDQFQISANGITRFGLGNDAIRTGLFAMPPMPEQRAIAAFLDQQTAEIDALVAKKEQLIELLQEKRAALITQAVTKGLNPAVPMKDSGVEWLGKIPAHWDVKRVKWTAKMESGHTPDKKVEAYWTNCDIPWISLNDTGYLKNHDYISDTAYMVNSLGLANSSARLLPGKAVVFSRDATVGLCAITTKPMAVSQHFIAWLCRPELLPEYLLYVFRSMTQELERLTMGATIMTIGMPDVKTLVTPLPPPSEQECIVEYIRRRTANLDALIGKVHDGIERLKEYRTALISAAVTGKIDVRDTLVDGGQADVMSPEASTVT